MKDIRMPNYVTRKDLEEVVSTAVQEVLYAVGQRFEKIETEMQQNFTQVNKRLDKIEVRLDKIEIRFDHLEPRIRRIKVKLDQAIQRIDLHDRQITKLRTQPT